MHHVNLTDVIHTWYSTVTNVYLSRWQDTHNNIKFPGVKQLTDLHFEVQNKLTSFYWRVSERSSQQQREGARFAQLEALCMLMSGE
jgi:hypothetical protein